MKKESERYASCDIGVEVRSNDKKDDIIVLICLGD